MDKSSSIKGQLIKVLAWLVLGGFVYLAGLDFYNGTFQTQLIAHLKNNI